MLTYPSLSYYGNGIVKANLSHNHGMAAGGEHDFWPYHLYRYNPVSGIYEPQVSVDAWDKTVREQDWKGNAFPEELDIDKDGMLYSYNALDGYSAKESEEKTMIDRAEYEEWLNFYIGDAELLSIPYVHLTKDNIQALQ